MKIFKIKKKSGGFRTIYAPSQVGKARMRLAVPKLNELCLKLCDQNVAHGFMPGKNPVTNAIKHVGFKFTLCMDLSDFFDSVTIKRVAKSSGVRVEDVVGDIPEMFEGGAAHQGPPTSPPLSNLAAIAMDREIVQLTQSYSDAIVYTRYADDMSFSCNSLQPLLELRQKIAAITMRHGFAVNERKTRVQWAGPNGDWNRVITGVAVGPTCVRATRKIRRRLRAALHNMNLAQANGLAEWCKLKLPKPGGSRRTSAVTRAVARNMARKLTGKKDVWQ